MPAETSLSSFSRRTPWNKGIGAKPPLRPNQVWSIARTAYPETQTPATNSGRWGPVSSLRVRPADHGN
jgi:hypothetical protein